jgi:hypothetical protein
MAFYFKNNNSYKKIKVGSLEFLSEKLKLDIISEYQGENVIDSLNKGKDIYGFIDPYDREIGDINTLEWTFSEKESDYLYNLSAEEI